MCDIKIDSEVNLFIWLRRSLFFSRNKLPYTSYQGEADTKPVGVRNTWYETDAHVALFCGSAADPLPRPAPTRDALILNFSSLLVGAEHKKS